MKKYYVVEISKESEDLMSKIHVVMETDILDVAVRQYNYLIMANKKPAILQPTTWRTTVEDITNKNLEE